MTRRWWFAVLVALTLVIADTGGVCGGIYLTGEPPQLPLPTDFRSIKLLLIDYRGIALADTEVKNQTPLRARYRGLREHLQAQQRQGLISLSERIDLGACYLRERQFHEAKAILNEAERLGDDGSYHRFLLYANQAAAFHGLAETEQQVTYYDQAIAYQRRALALWPDIYAGWLVWEGQAYRRAEQFYLRLLELRRADARRHVGRRPGAPPFERPDELFSGVRFEPLDGGAALGLVAGLPVPLCRPAGYRVGGIALDMWDRLPPDAPQVVLQLVFWFPYDDRLYWLLGEILNTRNQVSEASAILTELVVARNLKRVEELNQHRFLLEEAVEGRKKLTVPGDAIQLLAAFAPRGISASPGLGQAVAEIVWPVLLAEYARQAEPPVEPAPLPSGVRFIDWQALGVGFLAGCLVATLGFFQMRIWWNRVGDSLTQRRLSDG